MTREHELRDYLDSCVAIIGERSNLGLVLKHGTAFSGQRLPHRFRSRLGNPRQCFYNAYLLAERYPKDIIYCEGLARRTADPILHAWCVSVSDEVIDQTWERPHEAIYYGIRFNLGFVQAVIYQTGYYGVLKSPGHVWIMLNKPETFKWSQKDECNA